MSKRTDSIRSMFSVPKEEALSADNKAAPPPRVSAGSVRSLRETFSGVERENEELRARLAAGQVAIELDPNLIDPSPLADRFDEQDGEAFQALKTSLKERGQEIPVLVREHPEISGRYQTAYGHRRIRAARELGISVRAYIRPLSVEDLVIAQGVENSAREDLSFIERAVFAARLEDAGFERMVTQTALSVDRAEVSKLVAVARAIPADVIAAIGRARKIGRGRWQTLAQALNDPGRLDRARSAAQAPGFSDLPGEARFSALLSAANTSALRQSGPVAILARDGAELGRVAASDTHFKLTLSRAISDGFGSYLVDRIPYLFEDYVSAILTPDEASSR